MSYFDKIRKLDLEDNQIQFIKNAKRPIEYLEVLNLSKNLITRISNETFEGLIRLRGLNLSQNEISTLEPFALSKMTNLEVLNMRSNKLKSLESNCFVGIKKLTSLDLSSNELSTIPDGLFSDMENLVKLNLERNNIAFIGITGFSGLVSLTHLDLTGNWLANVHPDVFEPLPYPPGLKEQILLDENPLMCDCELRHLVSWISRTPFRVKNSKNLRCSFVAGDAARNAGKRLLELQSHDLCDWLVELRDMILAPIVVLIVLSLVIVTVCVLRARRKKYQGSMATMSTNYKSNLPNDSYSISSSHQGSSDHTQATNITTFTQNRIHLPASLVPASFSPPPIKNSAYPPTNQIPGLCQSNDGQSASTFVKNEVAKARSETAAKLKSGRTKPNRHKVAPKKSPKVVVDYYTSDEDDKTYSKSSYSSSESDSCTSYSEDDL